MLKEERNYETRRETMKLSEYQRQASSTAIYPGANGQLGEGLDFLNGVDKDTLEKLKPLVKLVALGYLVAGLAGETGEVCEKIKKMIRDSGGVISPEVRAAIAKELGDQCWYQSMLATELGIDMDEVLRENLAKLKSRKDRGVLGGSGDNR